MSPGDELAEVEGQPVQPARVGGRGEEGRGGRGWPGEVSWAILPKARAMQYHQKPKEKKTPFAIYSRQAHATVPPAPTCAPVSGLLITVTMPQSLEPRSV